jgi:hypothetical protein
MRPFSIPCALAWAAALALTLTLALAPASVAHARSTADVPYPVADAFSTAVRFVRIERGCKLVEKDADAGFVSFECRDDDKVKRGVLEIWKTGEGTRVQVTLGDDPRYVELRFLELLERKLRDERGTPPARTPAPPPAAPKTPADGGT